MKTGTHTQVPVTMTIKHCGKCGTCVERREALAEAGIPDPTDYE